MELRDNAEVRIKPTGNEAGYLTPNYEQMAAYSAPMKLSGTAVAREEAMFATGFSFDQARSLYGSLDKSANAEKSAVYNLADQSKQLNADGTPYTVQTLEAAQAPDKVGPLSKTMTTPEYGSEHKLLIHVTQVPEVPAPVTVQDALNYTSNVMQAGVQTVRQTEHYLANPNAINNTLKDLAADGSRLPGHFSQSADQLHKDVQSLAKHAMHKVDEVVQQIDKPMTPEQRARMAGSILPMFFFEGGKEIDPKAAKAMGLENKTQEELKALEIEKRTTRAKDAIGEVSKAAYEAPSKLVTDRIAEITEAIPSNSRSRITISVAVVEDAQGKRSVLLGTSEKYGYLRGIEPKTGETVVAGLKHAENDLVTYAKERGLKVVDIGATRPICDDCASKIGQTEAHISTSLKTGK